MRHRFRFVVFLFAVASCIDQKDYDLHSANINPSAAIPLVSGNLSIQDILHSQDSAYVRIDTDDLVYLEYSSSLVSASIRNLFTIPDKIVNQSIVLVPGTIPAHSEDIRIDSITAVVDFGLNPEHLSGIDFKSGTITYSVQLLPGTSNLPYDVVLTSSDLVSKTTHQPLSVSAGSGSLLLSDYTCTLNFSRFDLKMVLVLKATNSAINIGPNTSVLVNFSMTGMDFNSITGFFGDQTIDLPATTLNIGAFGNSLNSANVSFAQPLVTLNVVNDYGVPSQLTFLTFEARKNGATLAAQLNPASPISVAYPSVLGNSSTTAVAVTNAAQLLNFAPTSFYYNVSVRMNKGLTSGNDFLGDTSKLRLNLDVQIPLYGHASNIVLSDTAKIDLSQVSQSQVSKASLKVLVSNQLPLDAKIQCYLTDDKYHIIDSVFTTAQTALVKGSTVTVDGELQSTGELDQLTPLNTTALNELFTSKYIIIKAVMNTSLDASGNAINVKFKSKYTMKINIGLLADLIFNITF
jgi:hypothetical protein